MTDQAEFHAYIIGVLRAVEHLVKRDEGTLAAELRNFLLEGVADSRLQRVAFAEDIHIRVRFWSDAAHARRLLKRSG